MVVHITPPDDPLSLAGRHCPQCDYPLKGVSKPVCPECGSAFDLRKIRIAGYQKRTVASRIAVSLTVLIVIGLLALAIIFMQTQSGTLLGLVFVAFACIMAGVPLAHRMMTS